MLLPSRSTEVRQVSKEWSLFYHVKNYELLFCLQREMNSSFCFLTKGLKVRHGANIMSPSPVWNYLCYCSYEPQRKTDVLEVRIGDLRKIKGKGHLLLKGLSPGKQTTKQDARQRLDIQNYLFKKRSMRQSYFKIWLTYPNTNAKEQPGQWPFIA